MALATARVIERLKCQNLLSASLGFVASCHRAGRSAAVATLVSLPAEDPR